MTDSLLQNSDQPALDQNKNYLEELVGEGKKFSTPEELAKGKFHSDQTIEVMKRRLDELTEDYRKVREENVTRAKLEDLLDQYANKQQTSSDNTPAKDVPKPFDPQQIDTLVSNKIREYETSKKETDNFNQVRNKLKEKFGENYTNSLQNQINNMGLTVEDANALARKSPQAFFKTFGLEQQQQETLPPLPRGNQRSDSFAPTGAKERTWNYYQELKKTNPMMYYDRQTAIQMQEDAIRLGDRFQDGDYFKRGLHE